MLISIITSIVITASYLYFILYPLKYVISIFLGKYGLTQEISVWLHITCVGVLVILGQIHAYKWHIRNYAIKKQCSKCSNDVEVSNQDEESSHVSIAIDPFWGLHMLQHIYRSQVYRPRLHYSCKTCGQEEYICPYCHRPVGENDKKCPHCRKRIYWVARGLKIAETTLVNMPIFLFKNLCAIC